MLRLPDHQRSETLGIPITGSSTIALAHYCHCHKPTTIRLRKWFPKTGFLKYRLRPVQTNVITPRETGNLRGVHCRYPSKPAFVTTIRTTDVREWVSQQNNVQVLVQEWRLNFKREKLELFMRLSRMACTVANGSYTCSLICDFTYLGSKLSDAVSPPVLEVSVRNLSILLTIYQSLPLSNFIKIESRKMLSFYIYPSGAFLKSLSVLCKF